MAMGSGKLPLESFKNYLIQDYLYLVHFARANALASYKANNMEDVAAVCALYRALGDLLSKTKLTSRHFSFFSYRAPRS